MSEYDIGYMEQQLEEKTQRITDLENTLSQTLEVIKDLIDFGTYSEDETAAEKKIREDVWECAQQCLDSSLVPRNLNTYILSNNNKSYGVLDIDSQFDTTRLKDLSLPETLKYLRDNQIYFKFKFSTDTLQMKTFGKLEE